MNGYRVRIIITIVIIAILIIAGCVLINMLGYYNSDYYMRIDIRAHAIYNEYLETGKHYQELIESDDWCDGLNKIILLIPVLCCVSSFYVIGAIMIDKDEENEKKRKKAPALGSIMVFLVMIGYLFHYLCAYREVYITDLAHQIDQWESTWGHAYDYEISEDDWFEQLDAANQSY